jgi:hypothetical protein
MWDGSVAMEPRVDATARWARALCVGSFAFFLGVAGHMMAAGLLPGTPSLVALFGVSVLVSVPLLTRPASGVRLAALLVAGQTFIHVCLTATAGHRGDPTQTAGSPTPHPTGLSHLPLVDGRRVGSLQDAYLGTSDLPSTTPALPLAHLFADLQAHAPMMVAHLVAAALVGLWLAQGERCLWTLIALLGRQVLALVRPFVPVRVVAGSFVSYVAHRAPAGPRSVWLVRPDSRRGPPLLTA